MTLYKSKFRVETTRLRYWDYSTNGYYFVTVCVKDRKCLLGEIKDNNVILTEFGNAVDKAWHDLIKHYGNICLDEFVIMPNHIHGIIIIDNNPVETGLKPVSTTGDRKKNGLSEIVRGFKTFTSLEINKLRNTTGSAFWQPRYYDHIINRDNELDDIREYIVNNPIKWELDEENPCKENKL